MKIDIACAILIGGKSTRMNGINKSFLKVNGERIIDRNIKQLRSFFSKIIIITNKKNDFEDYKQYKIISDLIQNKGPLGGIHSALKQTKNDAIFFIAGDMPFIDNEIIQDIVESFITNNFDIVTAKSNNGIEPLVGIYSEKILTNLEYFITNSKSLSARKFIESQNSSFINIKNDKIVMNINKYSDLKLESAIKRYEV